MRESICRVLLLAVLMSPAITAAQTADLVVVRKSESRLYLEKDGQAFASFRASFGSHPNGHKKEEGDERTPEGRYVLDSKNANSAFYRSIHISYPNAQDIASEKSRGVKPGGQIMIHGQKNGWRSGSIGPTVASA